MNKEENMNKNLGIVFLVVGACVLVYGFNAADSVASDVSRFFNGTPTNRSIMLLMLGGVLTFFGVSSLTKKG
jgi:uncharacterized membrane protein